MNDATLAVPGFSKIGNSVLLNLDKHLSRAKEFSALSSHDGLFPLPFPH